MADDAAAILITGGALGCEVNKISMRPPIGKRGNHPVQLRAYFERTDPATLEQLKQNLQAAAMLADGYTPEYRVLVDPGWATMWQARFKPLPIGQHLFIVPPWHGGLDSDRIRVVIRPGQAFGTGHHASTAGTLSAIERLCEKRRIRHALDVGTGSGILAIALIKLGVANVIAIDPDATALANAKENARLNRVSKSIHF